MLLTYLKIGALVLAISVVFGAGWKTRDAFCDAAAAKAEVATLQKRLDAATAASKADTKVAAAQADELKELEEQTNALRDKISAGECLSESDVDWLRRIWPH